MSPTVTTSAAHPAPTTTRRAPARCSSSRATRAVLRSRTRSCSSRPTETCSARSDRRSSRRTGPSATGWRRSSTSTRSEATAAPHLHFAGDTPRTPVSTLVATAEASVQSQAQTTPLRAQRALPADRPRLPLQPLRPVPVHRPGHPRRHAQHRRAPHAARRRRHDRRARTRSTWTSSGGRRRPSSARSTPPPTSRAAPSPMSGPGRASSAAGRSSSSSSAACCPSSRRRSTSSRAAGDDTSPCGRRCEASPAASASGSGRAFSSLFFSFTGIFPNGESRPIAPSSAVATDWPVAALGVFAGLVALGWLVTRPRLDPDGTGLADGRARRPPRRDARARARRARRRGAEPIRAHLHPSLAARLALAASRLGARATCRARRLSRSASSARCSCSAPSPFATRFGFDALWYLDRAHVGRVRAHHPRHRLPRLGSRGRAGGRCRRGPLRARTRLRDERPRARADPGVDPSGGSAQPSHARSAHARARRSRVGRRRIARAGGSERTTRRRARRRRPRPR